MMTRRPRTLPLLALMVAAPTLLGTLLLGAASAPPVGPQATIRSFPIPTADCNPIEITLGPDNNLWFTEQNRAKIGRITFQGQITEFPTTGDATPGDITTGPDGALWFTEGSTGKVGRITTDGTITDVRFSTFDSAIGITSGPDGNVWFTDSAGSRIWRLKPSTGGLRSFPLAPGSFPGDIAAGSDGNLWFAEAGHIAKITPAGVITEFEEPVTPFAITRGPDGNIWFTERFNQRIGRVTPDGTFTFFTTPGHTLDSITIGPDGNLWFTEFGDDRVAMMTTDGVITEGPIVPGSAPTGISAGPRGTVWFLGFGSNTVYAMRVP